MKIKNFWGNKRPRKAEKVAHCEPYKEGAQCITRQKDGTYKVTSTENHHVLFFHDKGRAYRQLILDRLPKWKDPRDDT